VAIWTDINNKNMAKTFVTTLFILIVTISFSQTRTKADAKIFADNLYSQILDGKSISTLARLYSDDLGSAKDGGFIKFNPGKKQMIATFENSILQLTENQTSKPFETEYGYHIVKMVSKTDTLLQVRHILISFKK
jgi:parvulin-like peptidyl-prolyl isomerase